MHKNEKSEKKRILLLSRVFPPRIGGIENYVYNIYHRLSTIYEVTVITPHFEGSRAFDSLQSFRILRSPQLPFIRERYATPLIGMFILALKELLVNPPDQIHCDQVEAAIIGRLLAKIARVPFCVYGYGLEITDNAFIEVKRWAANKANLIIAISHDTACKLKDLWQIDISNIRLVHPGVDTYRFNPLVDSAKIKARHDLDRKRVILTTGRLAAAERYKGHDTVIECMPEILHRFPEAVYLIVGDGPDRTRLERLAHANNLDKQVIFAGSIPDEELPQYYTASDLFVMPSRLGKSKHGGVMSEGFGIVFVEASASGIPVVGTRVGGIPDAVLDGVTGLLVNPDVKEQVTNAITELLGDNAIAKQMALAGRKRVEQEFQWDFASSKVAAIIEELAH